MKALFELLDLEFSKCKNQDWVNKKTNQINDCITNNFFCITVDYKYGDFRDINTYIFKCKKEMAEFKNVDSSEDSKWKGHYFFSDGTEFIKNIDC